MGKAFYLGDHYFPATGEDAKEKQKPAPKKSRRSYTPKPIETKVYELIPTEEVINPTE